MTEQEIRDVVAKALLMRPPKFAPSNNGDMTPPSAKIAAIEDYLFESACVAAELEEALFYADALIANFSEQIDNLTGYEVALPRKPRDRITQADIAHAKRLTDPLSFQIVADMKTMRGTVLRQIDRFRFEAQWVLSRGYTLITGS